MRTIEVREDHVVGTSRTTASATLSVVASVMPAFLVGASGVFVREDLGFDPAGLGAAVAAFFAAAAASAALGGRLAERIGAGQAMVLSVSGSAAIMLSIAVLAHDLVHLVVLLALGGIMTGVAQPASDLALARGVQVRPALMFGVKMSALPFATLLAGASVPLVSLTIGWRAVFVIGAGVAVAVAIFVPRRLAPPLPRQSRRAREGDAAIGPLLALAVATGVGTGAATILGAFLVETVVADGIEPSMGGWLLVAGSVAGVSSRLFVGWQADRHQGWALYGVSAMLVLGAGGYAMLALGGPLFLTLGTLLAYAGGWGWMGLLIFAVVRLNPNAPASATGIVLAGGTGGAAVAPLAFGYIVTSTSFQMAWSLAAASAFVAAILVLAARNWLVRDRDRREATK